MPEAIKIKKGLNIRIHGKAEKIFEKAEMPEAFAIKPIDFPGVFPKLTANPGDHVKAGSVLFIDKFHPDIRFTSPVSGTVSEVVRGERRKILEIVIKPDTEIEYEHFQSADPLQLSRDEITENLLKSGLWPLIRQRPYAIIANPKDTPKAIFISCFDTAPLAPDYDFLVKGENKSFQTGINALTKFTSGKIHLNLNSEYPSSDVYTRTKNVQLNYFRGPHPTGNVGVQIQRIDPVNKGEVVWYLYPQDVIMIGKLFEKGIFQASKIVALTGSETKNRRYIKTLVGASVKKICAKYALSGEHRYISGNILTGKKIAPDGFIGFYDSQLTIIPEGRHSLFMGWAKPGFGRYSSTRGFFSWLLPDREYNMNTNLNGSLRAFVMTGEYERVFPMNIYPQQLLKAILIKDIELMEKMGIYEVAEEDFALCEFVCTSKINCQQIIREGIEMMIKETT